MRARNLKPGFFQNEQLAELPIEARYLFAGLWCIADREGRLEDRPRRIKMQVFPADNIDVAALLAGLAGQKLIERYTVDGADYIWIPSFLKHQRPHHKEAASFIPMFHDLLETPTQVRASTDLGTCEPALNPSSLNPESPLPPKGGGDRFPDFWEAYPKKIRKAAAMRVWLRKGLNANADLILGHLELRVRSDAQWLQQAGRFIPHPATWLNGDGWLDVYAAAPERGFVC